MHIKIKPEYPEAYNNMGNILNEQGKSEQAAEALPKGHLS